MRCGQRRRRARLIYDTVPGSLFVALNKFIRTDLAYIFDTKSRSVGLEALLGHHHHPLALHHCSCVAGDVVCGEDSSDDFSGIFRVTTLSILATRL